MGQWADGHESAKKCIGLYDLQKHASLRLQYAEDPCVQARAANSFCLWNLGYPDQAVQSLAQTIQLADQLQHAISKAYALAVVPIVQAWLQDPEAALLTSEACAVFSRNNSLPFWEFLARPFGGWALSHQGKHSEGIAEILNAIKLYRESGAEVMTTAMYAVLADAYRVAARYDDALSAVEKGLRSGEERQEGVCKSELLRLKGLILLDQFRDDPEPAERYLLAALEVARVQKARSMELRVSIDLARLWHAQGKANAAFDLLSLIHGWFTEGYGTRDFVEAKALLRELKA
jgi:tetratricopeptide (TPR) repeat protein